MACEEVGEYCPGCACVIFFPPENWSSFHWGRRAKSRKGITPFQILSELSDLGLPSFEFTRLRKNSVEVFFVFLKSIRGNASSWWYASRTCFVIARRSQASFTSSWQRSGDTSYTTRQSSLWDVSWGPPWRTSQAPIIPITRTKKVVQIYRTVWKKVDIRILISLYNHTN